MNDIQSLKGPLGNFGRPLSLACAAACLVACEINVDGPDIFEEDFPFADPPFVSFPPVIPEQEMTQAEVPPPPISGGHLEVGPEGRWVVAADPDRGQLYIVRRQLDGSEPLALHATVDIGREAVPGRVAVADAQAAVALRGTAEVALIDLEAGTLMRRAATCAEPRGLAFDDEALLVACASGELWTHDVSSLAPTRKVPVALDLRDVVLVGERVFVSTFRQARIFELTASGAIRVEVQMPTQAALRGHGLDARPHVAWRMRAAPDGSLLVLHQAATEETVATQIEGGYGGPAAVTRGVLPCSRSIVASVLTRVVPGEGAEHIGVIDGPALVVDVGVHPTAARVALASPSAFGVNVSALSTVGLPTEGSGFGPCLGRQATSRGGRGVTSVAYAPNGDLLAFVREPASIVSLWPNQVLELDDSSVVDTGHDIFHASTHGNLACASCHPEGGEDAHTWRFEGLGPRRTQSLRGGLLATAPFHWDAEFPDLDSLADDVFTHRMSGGAISRPQVELLGAWMDTLPAWTPAPSEDPAAVERGRQLFDRAEVACASCHVDGRRGGPGSHPVGTGGVFQVPPLEGLRYRFPLMHDGCASTLADRFDPDCGGDSHGNTDQLTPAERGDLGAYLLSL